MSPLDLLLLLGFVVVDASALECMKMPAAHIEPGATLLHFGTAEPKAGPVTLVTSRRAAEVLHAILGEPVHVPGFPRSWLLGFSDEPHTGFAISLRSSKGRTLVRMREWTARRGYRYWNPMQAAPLTEAVASWLIEHLPAPN